MSHQFINAWETGNRITGVYYVRSVSERNTKAGKPFVSLELQDRSGIADAKLWDRRLEEVASEGSLDWISVKGTVEEFSGALQLKIQELKKVSEPANLADYKLVTQGNRNADRKRLRELVDSVKNSFLNALLMGVLKDKDIRTRLYDAPGAVTMHDACIGGLLEHTLQVAELCDAVARQIPTLHRDLLLTGAILHDVGKTEELDYEGPVFDFTSSGTLVGHITLTTEIVSRAADTIPDFPPTLRDAILHLILSHHGKREWGSPVAPALPEAFVLSQCDYMAAKVFIFNRARAEAKKGMSTFAKGLDDRVYVGDIDFGENKPAEIAPFAPDWDDLARPVVNVLMGSPSPFQPGEADSAPDMVLLPICGRIAAGMPDTSPEHVEGWRAVPSQPGAEKHFLLRVLGDSMRDAHILDGDLVRVSPAKTAHDNDIVVALVDGENTVKRLMKRPEGIFLHPENPDFDDIVIQSEQDLRVQGKVVGLIRESVV